MSKPDLHIRRMQRKELDTLVVWASEEGWNPGLSDADIFWATDPAAFIAAELEGEMIGGGSIVSYGGQYGFMGFFIIHPDHRGQGLGNILWQARLQKLIERLDHPVVIGMDGVFDMQPYYAKGGFEFSHRDLRFEGKGAPFSMPPGIVDLSEVSFPDIDAYDRAHFPAPRSEFLQRWIDQPGGYAKGLLRDDVLAGFAVMRPCLRGHKIGPLFADDASAANDLFRALAGQVPGEPIFLDVPENNPAALAIARLHNMTEVFGCARMYYGAKPDLPEQQVFAVTTFELG